MEKNLTKDLVCGEKMTNISYAESIFSETEIIVLHTCVNKKPLVPPVVKVDELLNAGGGSKRRFRRR